MEDRHSGKNIAKEVLGIAAEFQLEEIPCLLTDNASNMTVAARETGIEHEGCVAHTLQLCVEDSLKLTPVSRALGSARKLVAHFNRSVMCTSALLDVQKDNSSTKPLKLVQDVQTRWNSSYFMMERLLNLRVPVYSVIHNESVVKVSERASLDISDANWKVMESITPVLKPFCEATEILGKENLPTGSAVYILVQDLMSNYLEVSDIDTGVASDMKEKIRGGMMKRFKVDEGGVPLDRNLKSPFIIATALDPRFKQLKILQGSQPKILHDHITELLEKGASSTDGHEAVTVKQEADESSPPAKKQSQMMFSCLLGDICDLTKPSALDEEFNDYLKEPVRLRNPLEWWKVYEKRFPSVSKLAKSYLNIPEASVPSERIFSVAGMTLTKLRSSLDSETLDQIIFINKNMKADLLKQQLEHASASLKNIILSDGSVENAQIATDFQKHNESYDTSIDIAVPTSGPSNVANVQVKSEGASNNPPLPNLHSSSLFDD